ncbi:MAG: hypothetical protein ABEI80_01825 [Haloplanus sp.]
MAPSTYDHVRPPDDDYPDGVYRVVGVDDGDVTLLRVADADGRRVHAGECISVGADAFERFESATNPNGNRPLGTAAVSRVEMTYWSIRVFGQQLAANRLPALAAGTLVVVGVLGDGPLPLPDIVAGLAILIGSLLLAYVGSGRL